MKAVTFPKAYVELAIIYAVLGTFALIYVVPFLWLIAGSLKTGAELFASPPVWIPQIPQWSNYRIAISDFPFFLYLRNTLLIIGVNIIGEVCSCTLVAYGFAKIEWRGRDALFLLVLATMMLPFQVTMVPLFILFSKLGWIGTFLPLTVRSFFGNPFFIFLLRQFFLTIPKELSEAAKIDGAGELYIYRRVILPLARPAVMTVVIFTFLFHWSDFVGPLLFLSNNKLYTLSLGVQQLMSQNDPRWNLLLAIGVTMTVPVLLIFFVLQKYFIQGITLSGIKG